MSGCQAFFVHGVSGESDRIDLALFISWRSALESSGHGCKEQTCDQLTRESTCIVARVLVGEDAEVADTAHQLVCADVRSDITRGYRGVEHLCTHRDEALDEVGMQRVEAHLVVAHWSTSTHSSLPLTPICRQRSLMRSTRSFHLGSISPQQRRTTQRLRYSTQGFEDADTSDAHSPRCPMTTTSKTPASQPRDEYFRPSPPRARTRNCPAIRRGSFEFLN